MELFNDTKNRYFLAIQLLTYRIFYGGKNVGAYELCDALTELAKDTSETGPELVTDVIDSDLIFDTSDKSRVRLSIDAPAMVLPSLAEKVWLKTALDDPHSRMLLDPQMRAVLKEYLGDTKGISMPMSVKRERVYGDEPTPQLGRNLRMVLRAIHMHRELIYSNRSREHGNLVGKRAVPCKVEYSFAQDKLRAVMWDDEQKLLFRMNLDRAYDLSLGDETELPVSVSGLIDTEAEPLEFIVSRERAALEKAVHVFSKHNRTVIEEDEQHYRFIVPYYSFEETELISDIMAFGPMLEVVSPQSIRDKVIGRIRIAQTLMPRQK